MSEEDKRTEEEFRKLFEQKEISRRMIAQCHFCNQGDEKKRGILEIKTEKPARLPIRKPTKKSHYECGIGKNNCSVLRTYHLALTAHKLSKRSEEPRYLPSHYEIRAG